MLCYFYYQYLFLQVLHLLVRNKISTFVHEFKHYFDNKNNDDFSEALSVLETKENSTDGQSDKSDKMKTFNTNDTNFEIEPDDKSIKSEAKLNGISYRRKLVFECKALRAKVESI